MATAHDFLEVAERRLHRIRIGADRGWARLAIAHGYGDHAGRYLDFMNWMAGRGVSCQAIDFHGQGTSSGRHGAISRWEDYVDDLGAICAKSAWDGDDTPLFVLGHSHGGLVVLAAGIGGKLNCAGVILSAPFLAIGMNVPWWRLAVARVGSVIAPSIRVRTGVGGLALSRDETKVAETRADPLCTGVGTPRWFVSMRRVQAEVCARAGEFRIPLLMLVAGADSVADSAASIDFFRRAGSNVKTLKEYPEHRHELLREIGREAIFAEIRGWMETLKGTGA